ncbi:MAG TPA: DUF1697 domain-containing protein [Thermoleophilia bacterium]|nr:DUF1697 domain-containing protein [Thermoleophilia bacterium]
MTRVVALLRAVNVGGRSVAMAELRRALETAGYTGAQTYLQSGNVVFEPAGDDPRGEEDALERLIQREFGLATRVLVLTADQIGMVAAANPFTAGEQTGTTTVDEKTLHVTYLFERVAADAFAALEVPAAGGEQAVLADGGVGRAMAGRAVYLHLPHGYGRSKLTNAWFERVLATPATTRNWRTTTALAGLTQT